MLPLKDKRNTKAEFAAKKMIDSIKDDPSKDKHYREYLRAVVQGNKEKSAELAHSFPGAADAHDDLYKQIGIKESKTTITKSQLRQMIKEAVLEQTGAGANNPIPSKVKEECMLALEEIFLDNDMLPKDAEWLSQKMADEIASYVGGIRTSMNLPYDSEGKELRGKSRKPTQLSFKSKAYQRKDYP